MPSLDLNSTDKQKEKSQGTKLLLGLFTAFKNIKLYKSDHPTSHESATKLSATINSDLLKERLSMSIQNLDGLFVINDIFFIEESLAQYELLHSLEEHNISAISFNQGVTEEETIELCTFLLRKKLPGLLETPFSSNHIRILIESKETWAKGRIRASESKYKGSQSYVRLREEYDEWIQLTQQTFGKLLDEQSIDLADLTEPMDRLIEELSKNPGAVSAVMSSIPLTNLHIQHSIHSMIYSIFIGEQLSLDLSTLRMLGLAALVHDFGRIFLPADFSTGYKLTKGDIEFIQLHARDGASFLAGVPGLPMSIIRVAFEHHIGFDGKGYPELSKQSYTNILSQIVGLADFASWATVSEDYYHKPIPLHRLVRTLIARAGTQFDPLLVKVFVPFLGLYPTGTVVKLTNAEQAVVIEPNLRNISRPRVAVEKADGSYNPLWLVKLGDESQSNPYKNSIRSIIGNAPTFELFLDLINDETKSKT